LVVAGFPFAFFDLGLERRQVYLGIFVFLLDLKKDIDAVIGVKFLFPPRFFCRNSGRFRGIFLIMPRLPEARTV